MTPQYSEFKNKNFISSNENCPIKKIEIVPIESGSESDFTIHNLKLKITSKLNDADIVISIPPFLEIIDIYFRLKASVLEDRMISLTEPIIIKRVNCGNTPPKVIDFSSIVITEIPQSISLANKFKSKEEVECPISNY